MKQKVSLFLAIFLLTFLLIPSQGIAQSTTSATLQTRPQAIRERMIQEQAMQQERMMAKENRQEMRASMEATIKHMRENAQIQFKAQREAFQEKVATIRDERKKQLVVNIATRMTTVNTNRTNQMSQNLEKLSSILTNIKNRAATAKTNGKDTTAVDTAVTNAESAIANAQSAVATQAGKEYVITLTATGEATLRNEVFTTTKQLQSDITTVYNLMVAAKQAVMQAYMALTKVIGTPVVKTSTTSAVGQ